MKHTKLIDELLNELSYRVGIVDIYNKEQQSIMSEILTEWGEFEAKETIFRFLNEDDEKRFKNPILNRKIKYTGKDGKEQEGLVGNLITAPKDSPGRIEAEKLLPPEGSDERDAINQEIGSQGGGGSQDDTKGGGTDNVQQEKPQGTALKQGGYDKIVDKEDETRDKIEDEDSESTSSTTLTKQEKSEQVDRIDGEIKTKGLQGEIKAPGDPNGGSTVNEISQGTVIKILEENDGLTNEQIEKELCNKIGSTKLAKVHICPVPGTTKMKENRESVINAGKAKHRRNQQIIKDEGLNPNTTTTSHVWGAKQSLENTVDDLCSQNITVINGLPADCNKDNLFVKNEDGSFKLDDNGQKIAKPVEFDENGNPINYMQVILNGGAGENPTDTMCVIVDTSKTPPRCEIVHDSDKMTTKDIQGNSGPLKTIELAQKEFEKLYENEENVKKANEVAEETRRIIVEGRAKVKEIISGQSKKWVSITQTPILTENKPKMDFIISILKNGQGKDETPRGLSSSSGKYYNILQDRYKKQLEDYKSKNPNATQEDLDYEMLRLFAEEYEKMSKYASYPPEEFADLKKRSKPNYKGEDRIREGDEDYIPADAKQPTGHMQAIVMRTMEREDEFNDGERTEPILTSTTLKEEYDKQTTALNNLREGMNELKPGSGDDFFVEQMIERFHFGVSVGENPGGIPSNRFNLVMGKNESGIRYETQPDGSVKIFRKISGSNYEEIDENGNKIEGGETRNSRKDKLETGDIATIGSPESINHCLGLDENATKDDLKTKITVDVIVAGDTNQAEAIIYNSEGEIVARQTIRSKTGPGGAIADTIQFEESFQNCLQLYSYRKSKQK